MRSSGEVPALSSERRLAHMMAVLFVCALPFLLYAPFLTEPFQRDEGIYAAIAQVINDGRLPYRDAFDLKPPLVFFAYALAFLMFGEEVWAPRLLAAAAYSGAALLAYVEWRLLGSRRDAIAAGLALALSAGIARFDTNANTEYFMVLPLTAGLVAYTWGQQTGSRGWYFVAGAANAVAALTRQTALFPFLFLLGWAVRYPREVPFTHRLGLAVVPMCAGAALVGLAVSAPFAFSGALDQLLQATGLYSASYAGDTTPFARIVILVAATPFPLLAAAPWVALAVAGVAWCRGVGGPLYAWMLGGWLVASLVGIGFVGRMYSHHFVQALPGLCLMVPFGLRYLEGWQSLSRARRRLVFGVGVAALVASVMLSLQVYLHDSPGGRHVAKDPGDPRAGWEVHSPALGRYLRSNSEAGDVIYNLGFQSELYFYADRRPASKYLSDRPFEIDGSLVEEALADLMAGPPVYFVDSARYETWKAVAYDRVLFERFLSENYSYLGKVYYADLYRLKDDH